MKKEIYVIGIGSNLGDRLAYIRRAIQELKKLNIELIETSKIYENQALLLPDAPATWNLPFYNLAIKIRTNSNPELLLFQLKKIENKLGRKIRKKWAPREIDLDILVWNHGSFNSSNLIIPHKELTQRLFALQPLSEIWPGDFLIQEKMLNFWLEYLKRTEKLETTPFRIDRPELLGIINLSPESFSEFFNAEDGLKKAQLNHAIGCEYVDCGAVSTSPKIGELLEEVEEWKRLEPFLTNYTSRCGRLSIDTFRESIIQRLLSYPIGMLNDQSGELTPEKLVIYQKTNWKVVLMHNFGLPANQKKVETIDVVEDLYLWLLKRVEIWQKVGLSLDRLIFDPGIGFGKTLSQIFLLLDNLTVFRELGVEILVGHSRKSFFKQWQQDSKLDLDLFTGAFSLVLKDKVDYLRVHEPAINLKWLSKGN